MQNILKKFLETGSIADKRKSIRLPLLSVRGQRNLCNTAKEFPFLGPLELMQGSTSYPKMSRITIKGYLRKSGLIGRIAAKKPMLTDKHMICRLLWCNEYFNFTADMWSKAGRWIKNAHQMFTLVGFQCLHQYHAKRAI